MSRAAAYLRKSRSDDPAREVSRDVQERAVRALAARDGHGDVELFTDWDVSADEAKAHRRRAFNRLLRAIEAGEISVVYAYAADRLYRSLESFIRITGAASQHGVRIVTERDGVIGGDGSPIGEFHAGLGALLGRLELTTAKARAKAAYEARAARGDRIGRPPYGWKSAKGDDGVVRLVPDDERPVQPVLDAYERAGRRVRTAVRILNDEMRLPAPMGGEWDRPTLLRIIARERPELLPLPTATGRREHASDRPAKLSRLLRCPCGRLLTPNRHVERNGTTSVSYYCARGMASREQYPHPRVYVAESIVLPFVLDELDRYDAPWSGDAEAEVPRDADAERAELVRRRRAVVEMRIDGVIDREETRRRTAEIDRALAALETRPPAWPSVREETEAEFNERARSVLHHVALDDMLRPVEAIWHDPSWRYAGDGLPPRVRVDLEEMKRESATAYLAEHPEADQVAGYRRRSD